jgi:hypothetical protein
MNNLRLFPDLSITNIVSSFGPHYSGVGDIWSLIFGVFMLIVVAALLLIIVPMCLVFRKAGRGWWEAIIPFYNMYVLTVITGKPWWVIFGFLIPFVNWIVPIYLYYHLSKRFGYDILFTFGLVFLPFIFLPILGFGSSLYTKPEIEGVL